MVLSASRKLSALQTEFLALFSERESRFFLTGSGALAGFYLGHRETHEIDLFTTEDALDDGLRTVADIARQLGASFESVQTSPDFRRLLLQKGSEAVVIDLVRDRSLQMFSEKPIINGIRVDPPEGILANKVCALLSRTEVRDLIDVRSLESSGLRIENALDAAVLKDAGFSPAQLAWVLKETQFGDDLDPPGGVSVDELRLFVEELVQRLSKRAFPR